MSVDKPQEELCAEGSVLEPVPNTQTEQTEHEMNWTETQNPNISTLKP